jgi:diguanylate cyclase (GGDEF)-like protein
MLGARTLKNLALSFLIVRELEENSSYGFDFNAFWKRSVTSAVAAETLAVELGKRSDDTFVTALLMNVGKVVLNTCKAEDYPRVLDDSRVTGADLISLERDAFSFDHQEVGMEVLKKWDIPESIYRPIAFHHDRETCPPEFRETAEILRISSVVGSVYNSDRSVEMVDRLEGLFSAGTLKLDKKRMREYIDEVADKAVDVLKAFDIDPGDMKPYSTLMEEANEELSSLNISYERMVLELKESKERSEKYALELKEMSEQLRQMAFRDALTGLYNQRFFHDAFDRELGRVERYSGTFALIMFDVDNFKVVNDNHGHTRGDMVLITISSTLSRMVRQCDMAMRLGGDEFAILLPDTRVESAALLAERIRKEIENTPIVLEDVTLNCTISAGVGSYDPTEGKKEKSQIIEEIDSALYKSKSTGRNRVTSLNPLLMDVSDGTVA